MLAVAAHAPSNPEAQVVLGVLYNISQDFDNATECFSRAIELSPPDYTLLNKVVSRAHRISSCLSKSHSQPPLSVLSIISSTKPPIHFICCQMGATLANNNKSDQAVQIYVKALNARPTYARGWLNLGKITYCTYLLTDLSLLHGGNT
jgi:tetratricopeptide (TPR) repeat protein